MNEILEDFRNNKSGVSYPDCIKQNVHAQAFYGVILPVINEEEEYRVDLIGEIATKITDIVIKHTKVDWNNNVDIHNAIKQDIEDMLYYYYDTDLIKLSYEKIDEIIEKVINVALKRF